MITSGSGIVSQNLTRVVIREGNIISTDSIFHEFTGFHQEDVFNKPISTLLNEMLKMRVDIQSLELGQQFGPFLMFHANNEVKEIEVCVEAGSNRDEKVCKLIEKSDPRLYEKFMFLEQQVEELKHQKEQLESIIENMPDGLFIVDENEKIMFLNEPAEKFFYISDNQRLNWQELKRKKYYDDDGKEVLLTDFASPKSLTEEGAKSYRLAIEGTDGIKHFDISGRPVFDEKEHMKWLVMRTRDVTEYVENARLIKEQRENLLKSEIEKNQLLEKMILMKDEFLSTISHEFKTPLNVINSAIQAMELLCKDELSIRAKKYIRNIRQNSFRQLRLVNNLLDITRAQAGKLKIYKMNLDIVFITKAIVESVANYAKQKGIKLSFVTAIGRKIIGIDEEKYERILLNLLSNAIRYTPEGKRVTVRLSSEKCYVRIVVKDDGVGIPEDKHLEIFERFGQAENSLTRQAEGTGIGLSLVKQLVHALGGEISVKSKEGKGSSFILLLPNQRVDEGAADKELKELTDNRLVQSIAIEFSDIYLS